jgi:hypothetical protein
MLLGVGCLCGVLHARPGAGSQEDHQLVGVLLVRLCAVWLQLVVRGLFHLIKG